MPMDTNPDFGVCIYEIMEILTPESYNFIVTIYVETSD